MVSTSRSLSWLPTVQLGPDTDSLASGLSWTLLTSTSEASPSGLVPQHQGEAKKGPVEALGTPQKTRSNQQEEKAATSPGTSWFGIGAVSGERLLILMNPQSSWLQSDFGTLWESEEEVGE